MRSVTSKRVPGARKRASGGASGAMAPLSRKGGGRKAATPDGGDER